MRDDVIRRRMLTAWLGYRRSPPTAWTLLRGLGRGALVSSVLLLAVIALVMWIGDTFSRGLATGFLIHMLVSLVVRLRTAARLWPITSPFVDWPRVEQAARDEGLS